MVQPDSAFGTAAKDSLIEKPSDSARNAWPIRPIPTTRRCLSMHPYTLTAPTDHSPDRHQPFASPARRAASASTSSRIAGSSVTAPACSETLESPAAFAATTSTNMWLYPTPKLATFYSAASHLAEDIDETRSRPKWPQPVIVAQRVLHSATCHGASSRVGPHQIRQQPHASGVGRAGDQGLSNAIRPSVRVIAGAINTIAPF